MFEGRHHETYCRNAGILSNGEGSALSPTNQTLPDKWDISFLVQPLPHRAFQESGLVEVERSAGIPHVRNETLPRPNEGSLCFVCVER